MSAVADMMPHLEEAAGEQLAAELGVLQGKLLENLNRGASRATDSWDCSLMMIHAARCLHDEAIGNTPISDAERWQIFAGLVGRDSHDLACNAVRKLLRIIREASGNDG
jgi:hypothetical protein